MKLFNNNNDFIGVSYKFNNTGVVTANNTNELGNFIIIEFDKSLFDSNEAEEWIISVCPFGYSEESCYRKWIRFREFEENNSYCWALKE